MLSLSPIQTWSFSPELLTYVEHNGIIQIHVEEMHAALNTSEFSKVFSKCLIVWKKSKSPVVPSYHKNGYKHTCTLARARAHTRYHSQKGLEWPGETAQTIENKHKDKHLVA